MSALCNAERLYCRFLDSQPPFGGLLVALSGGADSVTLLHLAHRMADRYGYRLEALHVHHGIRGDEADRDRDFCKQLCDRLHIPLSVVELDIPALAKAEGRGLEETARLYRYQALQNYAAKHSLDRIATAHTATDNLETVLLQLTRGSGSVIGIPTVRDCYLRPLLRATRADVLAYLQEWDLPHMEDSSNKSDELSRNLIRHRVLPVLQELNPKAEEAFARAAMLSREDNAYLDSLASAAADSGNIREIAALPLPLRRRALKQRCAILGLNGVEYVHLEALLTLVENGIAHSSLSLPGGAVTIEEGQLIRKDAPIHFAPWEIPLHMGENSLPDGSMLYLSTESEEDVKKYTITQQNIYKLLIKDTLNFATIEGTIVARSRKAGDRILSGGMHRSVKKLYCDQKLSLSERSASPLICDANQILWIPALGKRCDQASAPSFVPLHLLWFRKNTPDGDAITDEL